MADLIWGGKREEGKRWARKVLGGFYLPSLTTLVQCKLVWYGLLCSFFLCCWCGRLTLVFPVHTKVVLVLQNINHAVGVQVAYSYLLSWGNSTWVAAWLLGLDAYLRCRCARLTPGKREPWQLIREGDGMVFCTSWSLSCWRQQGCRLHNQNFTSIVYIVHIVVFCTTCQVKRLNTCVKRWNVKCKELLQSSACVLIWKWKVQRASFCNHKIT